MKKLVLGLFLGLFLVSFAIAQNSSCTDNICDLYEGETITHEGYEIQIEFMDGSQVRLNIDGVILGHHFDSIDQIYDHNDSLYIVLKDIAYSSREGILGYAVFNFTKKATIVSHQQCSSTNLTGCSTNASCTDANGQWTDSGCFPQVPDENVCKDEDGLDYFTAGETEVSGSGSGTLTIIDACLTKYFPTMNNTFDDIHERMINASLLTREMLSNDKVLLEGYCPDPVPGDLANPFQFQKVKVCEIGCIAGACIKEPNVRTPNMYAAGELVTLAEGETVSINVRGIDYEVYLDPYYEDKVGFEIDGKQNDVLAGEGEFIRVNSDVTIKVVEIYLENESGHVKFRMFYSAGGTIKDIIGEIRDHRELRYEVRTDIRESLRDGEEINFTEARLTLRRINEEILALQMEKIRILTRLRLHNEGNLSELKAELSNGRNAIIKIMPEVASERALARLRLKVCNETRDCSIELKEVGKGDKAKLVYEARARKTFKIWGFIKNRERVRTQIDAETGDVVETKRPWWAWMASEDDEADENEE